MKKTLMLFRGCYRKLKSNCLPVNSPLRMYSSCYWREDRRIWPPTSELNLIKVCVHIWIMKFYTGWLCVYIVGCFVFIFGICGYKPCLCRSPSHVYACMWLGMVCLWVFHSFRYANHGVYNTNFLSSFSSNYEYHFCVLVD